MKTLRNILGLHFSTLLLFGFLFPLIIWLIGLLTPGNANGLPIVEDGRLVGYENIGQNFTLDKYFHGRPSWVNYNAGSTGASNKGATNPDYLVYVKSNIDSFLTHNPEIKLSEIPVELVTASGSGIDPHISYKAALVQVPRIAKARSLDKEVVKELVNSFLEPPLLNLFGPEKINVLKLNIALDNLK